MTSRFTWSIDWIQEYESPWGILEKFMWANAIEGNNLLELIGNDNVKQLKNISNAGYNHRNLICFQSIDSNMSQKILGVDLKGYHDNLVKNLVQKIPDTKYIGDFFRINLSYCPICLSGGYHSILHQLKIFDYCAFHPDQKLIDWCVKCNQLMPKYLIDKGNKEAFRCHCGHRFLDSKDIRLIFSSWKNQPEIKNKIIKLWLALPRDKVHQYHIIYPFNNYKKYLEVDKKDTDYLRFIPKLLINSFNDDAFNNEVIKLSSNTNIFNIKNDYRQLKENYIKTFPHLFSFDNFKDKHRIDSIYFEIFKQTRSIYKAISRYILRKIIKEHSKCVKIFNKARQNGDVCPHALAFILWKMECEGEDAFWKMEYQTGLSENLGFLCMKHYFSIFIHGTFMTHLEEILNPIVREGEFTFLDCNVSSINYILNRIVSHLLIERYIKWLEVVQNPKKFNRTYPDGNIPMYIAKIPRKFNEEISFYFPNKRIDYMKDIIKDISSRMECPFNRSTKYPPYKSPMKIAIDNI